MAGHFNKTMWMVPVNIITATLITLFFTRAFYFLKEKNKLISCGNENSW
jgi:hypothetical protein